LLNNLKFSLIHSTSGPQSPIKKAMKYGDDNTQGQAIWHDFKPWIKVKRRRYQRACLPT